MTDFTDWLWNNLHRMGLTLEIIGAFFVILVLGMKLYQGDFATLDTLLTLSGLIFVIGFSELLAYELFYLHDKLEGIENAD